MDDAQNLDVTPLQAAHHLLQAQVYHLCYVHLFTTDDVATIPNDEGAAVTLECFRCNADVKFSPGIMFYFEVVEDADGELVKLVGGHPSIGFYVTNPPYITTYSQVQRNYQFHVQAAATGLLI